MQVQDNRGTLNNGCSVQLQQNLVPISLLTRVMPQSTILVGKLTAQHRKNPFILSKLWASYKYSALRCSYGRHRFKSGMRCSNYFFLYLFLLIFHHSDFHKVVNNIYLLYGLHDLYPQCLHKMAVWGLTSDICTRTLSLLSKVLYSLKAKHKMDYICTFKHNHIAHPTSLIPTHLSPFLLQLCYQIMLYFS